VKFAIGGKVVIIGTPGTILDRSNDLFIYGRKILNRLIEMSKLFSVSQWWLHFST